MAMERLSVGENVPNPLRLVAMLGQDVHASVEFDKPDFNFTRQTGFAAGRGEVEELGVGVILPEDNIVNSAADTGQFNGCESFDLDDHRE